MFYGEHSGVRNTAYLLLGSNMGDRREVISDALDLICREAGEITGLSSLYETEPVGFESDSNFLNMVVRLETGLAPEELLSGVLDMEKRLGRVRVSDRPQYDADGKRIYSSRPIDIDILLYADRVINAPDLEIPHPRMAERAFTMLPMAELAPALVHPVLKRTMTEIAQSLPTDGVVRLGPCVSGCESAAK